MQKTSVEIDEIGRQIQIEHVKIATVAWAVTFTQRILTEIIRQAVRELQIVFPDEVVPGVHKPWHTRVFEAQVGRYNAAPEVAHYITRALAVDVIEQFNQNRILMWHLKAKMDKVMEKLDMGDMHQAVNTRLKDVATSRAVRSLVKGLLDRKEQTIFEPDHVAAGMTVGQLDQALLAAKKEHAVCQDRFDTILKLAKDKAVGLDQSVAMVKQRRLVHLLHDDPARCYDRAHYQSLMQHILKSSDAASFQSAANRLFALGLVAQIKPILLSHVMLADVVADFTRDIPLQLLDRPRFMNDDFSADVAMEDDERDDDEGQDSAAEGGLRAGGGDWEIGPRRRRDS